MAKGSPNYWALPAMGDALGWTYRKGLVRQARDPGRVQEEHNRDLAPPKTLTELTEIAQFFQGREIDARRSTAPRSSPSAARKASRWGPNYLYPYGFKYEIRRSPIRWRASSTRRRGEGPRGV